MWSVWGKIRSAATSVVCNYLFGKTGQELHLDDDEQMLLQMTRGPYLETLKLFKYRTLIATSFFDLSVAFSSASIRAWNSYETPSPSNTDQAFRLLSFSGFTDTSATECSWKALLTQHGAVEEEELLGIMHNTEKWTPVPSVASTAAAVDTSPIWFIDRSHEVEYMIEMLHNLNSLDWRRLDIEFNVASSAIGKQAVHTLAIGNGRAMMPLPESLVTASKKWIDILTDMLIMDTNCAV